MRINQRLSVYLDLVRWLAAGAVVINHVRSYVFVEYALLTHRSPLLRALYFATGFGHDAVMIFFVLSGFLVGGKVIHRIRADQFDVKLYAINRVTRLYIVLIAALLIGLVLDTVGLHYLNQAGLYDGTYHIDLNSPVYSAQARLGIDTLVSNLLMCQTVLTPPLGTNLPLWSLANEFWYYILFPIVVTLLIGRGGLRKKGLLAALLLALVLFLPVKMLLYFLIWIMGALLALLERPLVKYFAVSGSLFVLALVTARLGILPAFASDVLVAIMFALTINTLVTETRPVAPRVAAVNAKLSGFSYSLYSIHYPVMVFVLSWISLNVTNVFARQPSLKLLLLYAGVAILLYLVSYGFSLITENNTGAVRKLLIRQLSRPSKAVQEQQRG